MESKILNIINTVCGAEPGELEIDLDLFDSGLLDSFAIVQMAVAFEEEFNISLDLEHLTREEIATPARIIELIRSMS